jgi:ADP-heptose:LPS heptosyltransferase
MLVVARDPNLGDSLCALPVLESLRQEHPNLEILFRNESVAQLMPKNLRERCSWDLKNGGYDVLVLGMWEAVKRFGRIAHPTQLLYMLAGLEPPKEVPRPKIVFDNNAPAYDYVVAPFTKDDRERGWDIDSWSDLFRQLAESDPGATICVVGGKSDHVFAHNAVSHCYGQSLAYVASMIKNARRAVITLDSGPSHIAHAVNSKNHILLMSAVNVREWAWPGARLLYAPPHGWSVKQVLREIERIAK